MKESHVRATSSFQNRFCSKESEHSLKQLNGRKLWSCGVGRRHNQYRSFVHPPTRSEVIRREDCLHCVRGIRWRVRSELCEACHTFDDATSWKKEQLITDASRQFIADNARVSVAVEYLVKAQSGHDIVVPKFDKTETMCQRWVAICPIHALEWRAMHGRFVEKSRCIGLKRAGQRIVGLGKLATSSEEEVVASLKKRSRFWSLSEGWRPEGAFKRCGMRMPSKRCACVRTGS